AMLVRSDLSYHDYEGVALDLDERERLVADIGDTGVMILRNHGTLSVGATAAEAYMRMFFLERACSMQVGALTAGRDGVLHGTEEVQDVVKGQANPEGMQLLANALAWPGLLRKLAREAPGYDT
ncbi:MAG: class II aldolase/adducin family protein, partial [Pseudomonadota bacterium]